MVQFLPKSLKTQIKRFLYPQVDQGTTNQLALLEAQIFQLKYELKKVGAEFQLYSSYAKAERALQTTNGYQNQELVDVIAWKQLQYLKKLEEPNFFVPDATWPLILALSPLSHRNELRIIDFGGGAGGHYFLARKFLPPEINLLWYVVETPALAKASADLEKHGSIHFVDSLDRVPWQPQDVDLFYSSGTLQCIPEPAEFLDRIISARYPRLLFNRMAFHDGETDLIGIQRSRLKDNGAVSFLPPGVEDREIQYPFTYMSRKRFDEKLQGVYQKDWSCDIRSGYFAVGTYPISGGSELYTLC